MIRDISELIVALIQFIRTYLQIVAYQVGSQIAQSDYAFELYVVNY